MAISVDKHNFSIHSTSMPVIPMPKGALSLLILRVLQRGPLHGYAIAQRIGQLSDDVLTAEEGSLYPALQRILVEGWAVAEWGISESGRRVRFYKLTTDGKAQLKREMHQYERTTAAIQAILRLA
jgi:PadR family transcriptional regulator, regulatory protein PadR